jgi:hypothetical protein
MHSKPAIALAACLSVATVTPLPAADTEGLFAIRGVGGQPCSAVVAAIDEATEADRPAIVAELATWLGGYLTLANRTIEGRFEVTPFVSDVDMLAIVVDRCEKEPELVFETAAFDIMTILSPYGPRDFSEVAVFEGSVLLRASTVSLLREVLTDKGYLEQSLDGSLMDALLAFNADQNIEATNILGIETVLRIFER